MPDYQEGFRLNVYSAVRGLWSGAGDYDWFMDAMWGAIEHGYEMAWQDGAAVCGLDPEDRTDEEQRELQSFIVFAREHVDSFAQEIEQNSKAAGGKLAPLLARADLWVNKWAEVRDKAKVMSCGNLKLAWRLGPTGEHCSSCLNYDGRVYRASTWDAAQIWPRSNRLECRGFNCMCELVPTTERITPGRVPKP